ncbi:peptide-methionine (S)-S-oxide reductase MsrA [Aerococcaceae bacterium DSM 111020]|nr:peptide-methionine (S)-S-oxide reductase MsrA [Aerococcaceae bacterium DSM 111020]
MALETAIFAGGCFWCMVKPFDQWDGVESVVSGYTGGHTENPTYREVTTGLTGHTEAVEITYNPEQIAYEALLEIYWNSMDPTDADGQFGDRGSSYRPVIYYKTEEQRRLAEASKKALDESGRFNAPIVVPIEPAETFYEAEDYHQDYYLKNPDHYNRYAHGSGRVDFIKRHK